MFGRVDGALPRGFMKTRGLRGLRKFVFLTARTEKRFRETLRECGAWRGGDTIAIVTNGVVGTRTDSMFSVAIDIILWQSRGGRPCNRCGLHALSPGLSGMEAERRSFRFELGGMSRYCIGDL